MDRAGVTYKLMFPRDMKLDQVEAFFGLVSGLYEPIRPSRYLSTKGRATVGLGILGTPGKIEFLLRFPEGKQATVFRALTSAIPDIGFEAYDMHRFKWQQAVRLRAVDYEEVPEPKDVQAHISNLLKQFTNIPEDGALLAQWVITPIGNVIGKDRAGQFFAKGILAVAMPKEERQRLGDGHKAAYRNLHVFRESGIPEPWLAGINDWQAPVTHWPCQLDGKTLAIICGWPIGSPQIAGLILGRGIKFMASPEIPEGPLVQGIGNYPDDQRPIGMSYRDKTRGVHVSGLPGYGKSTYMESQMLQDADNGHGFIFFDPHGDSALKVLDAMPEKRIKDVIYIDLLNAHNPVGVNYLEGPPHEVAEHVRAVFNALFGMERMSTTPDLLVNAVITLAYNGMTLVDIPDLINHHAEGAQLRKRLLKKVEDEGVVKFWEREYEPQSPAKKLEMCRPLLTRVRPFERFPALRGSLGQSKSAFNLDDVLKTDKIVIVHASKQLEETSKLWGSLFMAKLYGAVLRRQRLPQELRKPFGLYMDEFHNFTNIQVSLGTWLDEVRKFGLYMTLAHQRMDQDGVTPEIRGALLASAQNKVFFRANNISANLLTKDMGINPDALTGIGKYQALLSLNIDGEQLPAVTVSTLPPRPFLGSKPGEWAESVIRASEASYGKPLMFVEEERKQRTQVHADAPTKASSQFDDWED